MKIALPRLPLVLENIDPTLVDDGASLERCHLEDMDLTGSSLRSVSLDEVKLERVLFPRASLENLSVQDAILKSCDMSATQCSGLSFLRVAIDGGRMSGWDCSRGTLRDVVFTNCKLDMANFRFAKLTLVKFVGCIFTDADFLNGELSDVYFEDCLLERTEFNQCTMKNVDLRTSQLVEIRGWKYLKGAIIDNVQLMSAAPYLAGEVGIRVVD